MDQAQLNWKQWLGDAPMQPFNKEKFAWWRFYWDFGGGILTDLLTHWIDVIQWYTKQPAPKTATTTGDLYLMNWQCPDTITAAYEFPEKFMVTFTGALCDGIDDGGITFRGTNGALKVDRTRLAFYPQGRKMGAGHAGAQAGNSGGIAARRNHRTHPEFPGLRPHAQDSERAGRGRL